MWDKRNALDKAAGSDDKSRGGKKQGTTIRINRSIAGYICKVYEV